jgi:amino acid adenylation domain-containing protein
MKNIESFYPLSPLQEGMLFHTLYAPETGMYVRQVSLTLHEHLNIGAFERAWQHVADRHPILRTFFLWEEVKTPVQVVRQQVELPLEQYDWRSFSPPEQQERLQAFLQVDRARGFQLSEAPLMRLALIELAEDACQFIWSFHHLLLDGWSVSLVLKEVSTLYQAFCQGKKPHLGPSRPYRDYIAWLQQQDLSEAELFWRRMLDGFTTPTPLVMDRAVEGWSSQEQGLGMNQILVPASTTTALQSLARHNQLTLSTLVHGAWALLLSRTSGEDDVVFGSAVSGRPAALAGVESMVGLLINSLVVRVRVPAGASLLPWLNGLQSQQLKARQYEYTPLMQVRSWSQVPRDQPLFESMVAFENFPMIDSWGKHSEESQNLGVGRVHSTIQADLPLTLQARPGPQLSLEIYYDHRRFDADTITRMLGHLQTILESMIAYPDQCLGSVSLLTEPERQQLLVDWNDTGKDYPQDQFICHLFETQVERTPDAVAIVFEDQQLTYRELNRRVNRLADHLQRLGVRPEMRVGIFLERSVEIVVAVLGVLKAGGAFVPLDPTYPQDRLLFMLEDAQVAVLLTQERLLTKFQIANFNSHLTQSPGHPVTHSPTIICLDTGWGTIAGEEDENPASGVSADNSAYVIYTSGSTGRPKGVVVTHRGLRNLAQAQAPAFGGRPDSRVLQFASISFDASVWEIFGALLIGAKLCLARQDALLPGPALIRLLREQAITTVTLSPSVLAVLPADELPGLRTLITAGEACSADLVMNWAGGRRFFNAYGPTEGTVCATVGQCVDEQRRPSIGRPVANTQIYLLDRHLQPVPVAGPGQLCIGGASLARGYLHRPDITAEKFIPHPFSQKPGARLYQTGDLARYRPDGQIEFLGRIDHQVKIRGFRIELGEIEAVLGQHAGVREARVLAREDVPGDQRLVAYVVADPDPAVPIDELRRFLRERLPEYMVPSAFVMVDALPLTPNGKLDRQALPAPGQKPPELDRIFVAPRDDLEFQLAQIWEELLNIRPIGVTSSFFDLGGHSILAVRLMTQIQKRFSRDLPLSVLFQAPTIEHLADLLRQQTRSLPWSPLAKIQPTGSKLPLFLIHPIGGEVLGYAGLARHLGPDQPLYGLQAPNLAEVGDDDIPIEDMAAFYIEAIRTVQPEAPYLLGGWSFGGIVAFEMAHQLHREGQEVALLIMLDTWSPDIHRVPPDDAQLLVELARTQARMKGKDLSLSPEYLRGLDPDQQVSYVLEQAKIAHIIPPDIEAPWLRRFLQGYKARGRAVYNYLPPVYPDRITLFRASKKNSEFLDYLEKMGVDVDDPTLGWGKLSSEPVEIHIVPGYHETMCQEPYVQALAGRLSACIQEATEQRYAPSAPVTSLAGRLRTYIGKATRFLPSR